MGEYRWIFSLIFLSLLCNVEAWWCWGDRRDCSWHWSSCSHTCGNQGTRHTIVTRDRGNCGKCNRPSPQACNRHCCPVNCYWLGWGAWSMCSQTCGSGVQSRKRGHIALSCGGASCRGDSQRTRPCNANCCPIHCSWASWGSWGSCSASCAGGTQTRYRGNAVSARCGGRACTGGSAEVRSCNSGCCPVHCSWSSWGLWGSCSASCAGGTQTRRRGNAVSAQCGGRACSGGSAEARLCNTGCCPVHCSWAPWGLWGSCSAPCAGGTQLRTRENAVTAKCGGFSCDGDSDEVRACNTACCPVDCELGDWGRWSTCSHSCGDGLKTRQRSKEVVESCGGQCVEPLTEESMCNEQCCVTDCEWEEWGQWETCSKSCDVGIHARSRNVSTEASCGGVECQGNAAEEKACNEFCCPDHCQWSEWVEWTECSRTCGVGDQLRLRDVTVDPTCKSQNCLGPIYEERTCTDRCCLVDCRLSTWTSWTECSLICGESRMQQRSRNITQQMECNGAPCEEKQNQEQQCDPLCLNGGVFGGEWCNCLPGWTGECCEKDVNECDYIGCPDYSTCTNTDGSYECVCSTNFTMEAGICIPMTACHWGTDDCDENALCISMNENYICECQAGFIGNGNVCQDVDECAMDRDLNEKIQEVSSGSGDVEELSGSAFNQDERNVLHCSEHAVCTNTYGSYTCECMLGFSGNGTICEDVDECVAGMDICEMSLATCFNTDGGFSCICDEGLSMVDGKCQEPVPE